MAVQQLAWRHFTKKHSLSLRPEVVVFLQERLAMVPEEQVGQIIEYIANAYIKHGANSVVELNVLEEIIRQLFRTHRVQTESVNSSEYIHLIEEYPMLCLDRSTGEFVYKAESDVINRYIVLLERVQRHLREHAVEWKLVSVKSLKTRDYTEAHVFGMIYRRDEEFILEDLDDFISVNLGDTSGLLIDGQFIIARGSLVDGVFTITEALNVPHDTQRSFGRLSGATCPLRSVAKETESVKTMRELEKRCPDAFLACFSELWLDRDEILADFKSVLKSFSDMNRIPSIIVLLGSFHSDPPDIYVNPGNVVSEYQKLFEKLAGVLKAFPGIVTECRFIVSPGPKDPFAAPNAIPRPKMPSVLFGSLTNAGVQVLLSADPVRLFWFSKELVFTRDEIGGKLERAKISGSSSIPIATMALAQGFLQPFTPDHSLISNAKFSFGRLSLIPPPDLLVIAEKDTVPDSLTVCDTAIGNPGRFADTRSYMLFDLNGNTATHHKLT